MASSSDFSQRISPLDFIDKLSLPQTGSELRISELRDSALLQLFAVKGREQALAAALGIAGTAGRASVTEQFTALPLSQGQWMLSATEGGDGSFCERIRARVQELGFVSEQSHSRSVIRVAGGAARDLMQRGCRLDLHPAVSGSGFCAQTTMAQVGVLIHQLDELPSYDLYLYSGFTHSFWQWLTGTAAQFGYTAH